eukprot:Skav208148  [mRNA]  locus=scaffold235:273660:279052:- [translate_table: standard]
MVGLFERFVSSPSTRLTIPKLRFRTCSEQKRGLKPCLAQLTRTGASALFVAGDDDPFGDCEVTTTVGGV